MLLFVYVSLVAVSLVNSVAGNCLVNGYCGAGQCCSAFGACGTGSQYCGGGGGYLQSGWSAPTHVPTDCRIVGCRTGSCCSPYGHCGQSIEYCGGGVAAPSVPFLAPVPVYYQCQVTGCPVGSCCAQQGHCASTATYCAAVSYNNCGTTSCGVGLCCTRFGYCDRVGAHCGYQKSSSQPVSLEGEFQGQATYYNETKVGTQYSTCGIERGLPLDENNENVYSAALNEAQFDPYTVKGIPSSNPICQKKALVKGSKGEIVVRFIDRCFHCKPNDIALTKEAFIAIAGELGSGETSVEWHFM